MRNAKWETKDKGNKCTENATLTERAEFLQNRNRLFKNQSMAKPLKIFLFHDSLKELIKTTGEKVAIDQFFKTFRRVTPSSVEHRQLSLR